MVLGADSLGLNLNVQIDVTPYGKDFDVSFQINLIAWILTVHKHGDSACTFRINSVLMKMEKILILTQ